MRSLNDEIRGVRVRYREIEKEKREGGRARSEEHRQTILKAHYQMQSLKTTIAQIKANKYVINPVQSSILLQHQRSRDVTIDGTASEPVIGADIKPSTRFR